MAKECSAACDARLMTHVLLLAEPQSCHL